MTSAHAIVVLKYIYVYFAIIIFTRYVRTTTANL